MAKKKKADPGLMVNPALSMYGYFFGFGDKGTFGPGDKVPKSLQDKFPRYVHSTKVLVEYAEPQTYMKPGRESSAGDAAVKAEPRPPRESSAPKSA